MGINALSNNPARAGGDGFLPPPVLTNPSVCNLGFVIPDFSCGVNNIFQINVASAPGNSLGTNVFLREIRLIITHPWAADLDIYLVSPSGVRVELSTDNGSGDDDYGIRDSFCNKWTSFISASSQSACGAISIVQGQPPFLGKFLPEGNLNDFNTGANPVGLWSLEVCDDGREHVGKLEYVELAFESVSCVTPSALSIVNVDSTSVTLNWKPGSTCAETIVEYGLPGFTPGSGTTGSGIIRMVGCPPWKINSLNPATPYDLYLREKCGPSSFSGNSCKISFVTRCSPPPATISSDFNNLTVCDPICGVPCNLSGFWRNARNDHFDWIVHSGPSPTSQTGAQDDFPGGGKYLYIETSGNLCQSGNEAIIISNCVTVKANSDSCDMSFNYLLNGAHIHSLSLQASVDGGKTWQSLWQESGHQGTHWLTKYIDLDHYHNKITQFRFVGRGGNGPRGDIAIDNVKFYGSVDLGAPAYHYYLDADRDGYGRTDVFISSCQPSSFPGYVSLSGDCDDNEPVIYPGQPESPCDGVDLNCNGMADEGTLPPPAGQSISVCNGKKAVITATPAYGGTIEWYVTPAGGQPVFQGSSYEPSLPQNLTNNPVIHYYYAQEVVTVGCQSATRKEITITIHPQPKISATPLQPICTGTQLNLSTVNVADANGANGALSFFSKLPLIQSNEIGPIVTVNQASSVYIVSKTSGGCSDSIQVVIPVFSSPFVKIQGESNICRGNAIQLKAVNQYGGIPPFTYLWNTGARTMDMVNFGNNEVGQVQTFTVTITDSKGCQSTDSKMVTTVANIVGAHASVTPVSTCNGKDGTVVISPLSGISPFTYKWNGGSNSVQSGALSVYNLAQGTYSFTISDSSPMACSFTVPVVLVPGPAANVTIKEVKNVSCSGGSDGCITLEVEGNNPTILWSNGSNSTQICGLKAGTYSVTISDGGCVNTLKIPVSEPRPLSISMGIKDVSCKGMSDGSIYITVFGGTTPYLYSWNNGSSNSFVRDVPAGMYRLTITDAKGCSLVVAESQVKEPGVLDVVSGIIKPVSCHGNSDGSISLNAGGGTAPYSYSWSNGAAGSSIANISSGDYQLTITDAHKCSVKKIYSVTQPLPLVAKIDTAINPVCKGIHNGAINITPSGGNGSYNFLWNHGSTAEDVSGLAPGKYFVQVRDKEGCTSTTDSVILKGPESMVVGFDIKHPTCIGINNGHIQSSILSGGQAPFKYSWNTDFSGTALFNLAASAYSVTITDNKGCKFDTTITLLANQPITVQHTAIKPSCFGTASGQLLLHITGGLQPYGVRWSTGQQGTVISGLPAANYSATITDSRGCVQTSGLIPLAQPPSIQIKTESIDGLVCNGDKNGSINVTVSGGTAPYRYFWSNNRSTEDIQGLAEGTYQLTVTDAANCVSISNPFSITAPSKINVTVDTKEVKPCEAVSFDNVCLVVSGGVKPYKYEWNNPNSLACLSNAAVGDYSVTVTDAVGCSQRVSSVKVPDKFIPISVVTLEMGIKQICNGANNGSVAVALKGGAKPFQYIWSNGLKGVTNNDTLMITNLSSSNYRVTITDNTGCVAVSAWLSVISSQPLQVTIPSNQIGHVKCKSGMDGAINANIGGGYKPYTFKWTNALKQVIASTEDINNLGPGIYSLVVSDSLGCTTTVQATIQEPENVLSISGQTLIQNVACFENQNGAIDINVAGGTPPYRYKWNTGSITEDISKLQAGIYQVTITDTSNCTLISPSLKVDGPSSRLSAFVSKIGEVSCYGKSDGFVNIQPVGGTAPYTYLWSNSAQTKDLSGLKGGAYSLTITDKNLCRFDSTIKIHEPSALILTSGSKPSINGNSNGMAFVSATGGKGSYTYTWANGTKGDTLRNLIPGNYTVTVTDSVQCLAVTSVAVDLLVPVFEKNKTGNIILSPNPTTSIATLSISGSSQRILEIKIYDVFGRAVNVITPEKSSTVFQLDLSSEPPGIYWVTALGENKQRFTAKLVVLRN